MEFAIASYIVMLAWEWKQILFPPKAQEALVVVEEETTMRTTDEVAWNGYL